MTAKIGELLVQEGRITHLQLQKALNVQTQNGGRVGSTLCELDYVTLEDLLELLGKQQSVKVLNLLTCDITFDCLKLIPLETMKRHKVLPLACDGKVLSLGMCDPVDINLIKELEFSFGRSIRPYLVLEYQMNEALRLLEARGDLDGPLCGKELQGEESPAVEGSGVKQLFQWMLQQKGSDLLLSAGALPCMKKHNEMVRFSTEMLTTEQVHAFALELMTEEQRAEFHASRELDFAYTFPDLGRFRINVYRQRNSISVAARHIIQSIPSFPELGIPDFMEELALRRQGLILITGPTGHGKTTTLASIVDFINTRRRCNIITLEDPIEYLHRHKCSNVNQREVGIDTESFQDGLKHIFRQAPDVIVIGELRDPESFAIAVEAANTGHLVLTTFHANTATSALDRLVDEFSSPQQVRSQLADCFILVLNQRLVPAADGKGRVLVYEKLLSSPRTRNQVREGKTYQIRQQTGDDFQSLDQHLMRLYTEGKISRETGILFSENGAVFGGARHSQPSESLWPGR